MSPLCSTRVSNAPGEYFRTPHRRSRTGVMPSFNSLDTLARWTRIALYGCAAFYALSAAALPSNLNQLDDAAEYERSVGQTIYLNSTPSSDFATVGAGALILTAIVFLVFFYRAYVNLSLLGPSERRYGTGWAVGAWFIPIVWLIIPKKIANDIWRGSDSSSVPAVFHWWWAFWLIGGIAYFGYDKSVMTIAEAKRVVFVQASGELILVAAALCAAKVVGLIARRQHLRAELIQDRQTATFFASPERIVPQAG